MIYVIQVMSTSEEKIINIIKKSISSDIVIDIFSPSKERLKKLGGIWKKVNERVYPGYIFVETNNPLELHQELYKITYFTKLLGIKDRKTLELHFKHLTEDEEIMINTLMGKKVEHIIRVSKLQLLEGKKIIVLDGPLQGLESLVTKVDTHKKTVTIKQKMLNQEREIVLSAEIVKEIN